MYLKKQIKQTLLEERQRKLEESFVELYDINDKSFLLERTNSILSNLIKEGYSFNEITEYLTEDYDLSSLKDFNWKDFALNTSLSMVKEYIIEYVLSNIFGTNKELAHQAATVFAQLSPTDLLKPFKDEASCSESMPKITKALLGALLRHLAGEVTGTQESNVITTGAGTIFQQAIMRSNIGQELSVSFCKMIH